MKSQLFRYTIALGMLSFISCDLGDLEGPIPPAYSRTTNPPYEVILDSTNLIGNSGFEESLTGWILDATDGARANFSRSHTAKSGQYSLYANIIQLGQYNWAINAIWESLPLENGERYQVELWVRSTAGSGPMKVSIVRDGSSWQNIHSLWCHGTEAWKQFSFDFTAPDPGGDECKLELNFPNIGYYWIDEVKVQQYVQVDL